MENVTKTAQEAIEKMPQMAQDATNNLRKAIQNFADNLAPIMDKLAGTQSNLKLNFENLTLETDTARAKISGSINLEVAYIEQPYTQTQTQPMTERKSGDTNQVDRTRSNKR